MTETARRDDVKFMQRCLDLAVKGRGAVSPNPLVGAVIVRDGRIIGEGYHRRYGGPHAEVNAIADAERRGEPVEGATIYVSLEPCYHHGNTPPCVDLVLSRKLKRVVAAVTDPNPLVNGKSIRKLRREGVECATGVRKREAERLNAPFFTFVQTRRPFVALKTAQTSDGFIARADGSSKWITNERSRRHVHMLRATFDAVLVGAGTVAADDPMLTVRDVKGRNPIRIVLDGSLNVSPDASIVRTAAETPTIIYTTQAAAKSKKDKMGAIEACGAAVVPLKARRTRRVAVDDVLADLAAHQITSVLVEGGSVIYREFLRARAADVLYQFTAPCMFGFGIPGIDLIGAAFNKIRRGHVQFGKDSLDEYDLTYPDPPAALGLVGSVRRKRKG